MAIIWNKFHPFVAYSTDMESNSLFVTLLGKE